MRGSRVPGPRPAGVGGRATLLALALLGAALPLSGQTGAGSQAVQGGAVRPKATQPGAAQPGAAPPASTSASAVPPVAANAARSRFASPAVLLRGPEARRGLPFFGGNAIPCLAGLYAVGDVRVPVWSCRDPLYLGAAWKPLKIEGRLAASWLLEGKEGPVLALAGRGYTLFLEAPGDSPPLRRFALAFERRFSTFFANAPSDAELSFPAFVDFAP